jgi:hypothetical protein
VSRTHTDTHTSPGAYQRRQTAAKDQEFSASPVPEQGVLVSWLFIVCVCSQSHKNLCSIFRSFTSCRPTYETAAANQKLNAEVPDRRLRFDKAFFALCGAFCCHRAKKWSVQAHKDTHGHTHKKNRICPRDACIQFNSDSNSVSRPKKLYFNPSHP